jgi:hypothetical protein
VQLARCLPSCVDRPPSCPSRKAQSGVRAELKAIPQPSCPRGAGAQVRSRQTVAQYLTGWLDGVNVRASTYNSYRLSIDRLLPHIGHLSLQALNRADVRKAYKAIGEGGATQRNKNV